MQIIGIGFNKMKTFVGKEMIGVFATILCFGMLPGCDVQAQSSVKIYPQTIRVQKGKTVTVTAAAFSSPSSVARTATFTFGNGNAAVAGIGNTLITGDDITTPLTPPRNLRTISGLSAGTTTITATWNSITSAPATVIVDDTAQAPTAIVSGDNGAGTTINTKVGEAIEVDAEASRGVEKIEWNWGDGDKTTELLSVTHAYLIAGTYNLRLTVTNSTGQTATRLITVNVAAHAPATRTINVTTLAQLLTAYNTCTGGEHIVIPAGTVLNGQLVLPARNFSDYVTIRSGGTMPDLRDRISPTSPGLVTIRANTANGTPLTIEKGAAKIRIIGLKFEPRYQVQTAGPAAWYLAQIGESFTQNNISENPTKIILQHVVVNPPNDVNVVHAVLNDGYKVSIISSWLGNIKTYDGTDSQAIASFDGRGAHVYNNNYLEASAENIMYGGVKPNIPDLMSSNIEVRRCHFYKRLAWRVFEPNGHHTVNVKNLLEMKSGRRMYLEGNVFENHWDAGRGQRFALVMMSGSSPDGSGDVVPQAVTEDIVFENNRLKTAFGGLNTGVINDGIEPFFGLKPSNIVIKNMLFEDISNRWGYPGFQYGSRFLQPNNVEDLRADHVTLIDRDTSSSNLIYFATGNNFRFRLTNSIVSLSGGGIGGSNVSAGIRALNPGTDGLGEICTRPNNASWTVTHNVMPRFAVDTTCYPTSSFQNQFPSNYTGVGFVDYNNGNYQLAGSSSYRNTASDGTDPGVNFPVLTARTSCTVSGLTVNCVGPVTAVNYSVSGRISETSGRGVYMARVAITDGGGEVRYAMSNSFGYFRFPNVSPGSYVVSVVSKNRTFTPLPANVSSDISDLNFVFNR